MAPLDQTQLARITDPEIRTILSTQTDADVTSWLQLQAQVTAEVPNAITGALIDANTVRFRKATERETSGRDFELLLKDYNTLIGKYLRQREALKLAIRQKMDVIGEMMKINFHSEKYQPGFGMPIKDLKPSVQIQNMGLHVGF